jgi:hypothetical protein
MRNYAILFMLLLATVGFGGAQNPSTDRKQAVDQLADLVKRHQIERVEILHVPDDMVTVGAITPETVREISRYTAVTRKFSESALLPTLLLALKEIEKAPEGPPGEVRWAILFFDATGKERSAVFLSRNGKLGFFEGSSLSLQGKLLDWSKNLIRSEFLEGSK